MRANINSLVCSNWVCFCKFKNSCTPEISMAVLRIKRGEKQKKTDTHFRMSVLWKGRNDRARTDDLFNVTEALWTNWATLLFCGCKDTIVFKTMNRVRRFLLVIIFVPLAVSLSFSVVVFRLSPLYALLSLCLQRLGVLRVLCPFGPACLWHYGCSARVRL